MVLSDQAFWIVWFIVAVVIVFILAFVMLRKSGFMTGYNSSIYNSQKLYCPANMSPTGDGSACEDSSNNTVCALWGNENMTPCPSVTNNQEIMKNTVVYQDLSYKVCPRGTSLDSNHRNCLSDGTVNCALINTGGLTTCSGGVSSYYQSKDQQGITRTCPGNRYYITGDGSTCTSNSMSYNPMTKINSYDTCSLWGNPGMKKCPVPRTFRPMYIQ
jgi:hypothetical protein